MKIYIGHISAGGGGYGTLKGSLRHFDRLLESELNKLGFNSSFDELWLRLACPSIKTSSALHFSEKMFSESYDKFPYSRLDRKYKKIDITLKVPELSEYYINKADLSEIEVAYILIDKFLESGSIISTKIKKGDIFDLDRYILTLTTLKEKLNPEFLQQIGQVQKEQVSQDTIEKAKNLREARKQTIKQKDQLIRDFRVYDSLGQKALYPYSTQYSEIFRNLLREHNLMCPTYHHLYVQVAKTYEEALKQSAAYEDFYVNGLAVIDFDKYNKVSEEEKQEIVLNLIVSGLKDIAEHDHLDNTIIDTVISVIKKKGLDTELVFKTIENNRYLLTVTYFSKSIEDGNPIYFTLTDKTNNKTNRIEIGRANNMQIYEWLQKISISGNKIKVKSSSSIRADVALKELPREMEFNIEDILSN